MRFPLSLLGLFGAQAAFQPTQLDAGQQQTLAPAAVHRTSRFTFVLKEGPDVFSPRTLVELRRPGAGVANEAGDLVLVPYTQFSLDEKTNNKSILIAPLEGNATKPLEIPLPGGGEAFWLGRRSIGHAVDSGKGVLDLYAYALSPELQLNLTTAAPTAGKFKYSEPDGALVFVDYVYADGNLTAAKEQDERRARVPNAPMVFDELKERFWDSWLSPKSASLFSVGLARGPGGEWKLGSTFENLLQGTRHTSDDFSFVGGNVLYTSRDPDLSPLNGTRNVHLVKITDPGKPVQLTTGKQGGTSAPLLNSDGTKAAWIQEPTDTAGSSINKIIVYDLGNKDRVALAPTWDRSPESLAFSLAGDVMYFTAQDHARVKVYALPIPPTLSASASTGYPLLPKQFHTPVPLTHKGAASGVQLLPGGRLLFSRSSFASPDDVYVLHDLSSFESNIVLGSSQALKPKIKQVTRFNAEALESKGLDEGEEFWFKGALDRDVQGWLFKPKGWDEKDTKKWPLAMVIHGGPHGTTADQWSDRWNPNVFSQQGYFSIWMNPTGSTSFGGEFAESIVGDWGGKPFVDMVQGFKYVLESYPQIDPDRVVAAGASWGGYAINWLQGHPEYGFNFKALVCHDGVFDSSACELGIPSRLLIFPEENHW
ncbi:hypothetical protein B0H14DRAFT_2918756 [Mycena olivaceomarginata]|nr:hypothetical protein B0H14DRAFT_2918756 [Mycena olivaceomarginata]